MAKKKINKEERKKEGELDFDFGIGKLSLGGLFKGIEKLVDFAADMSRQSGIPTAAGKESGDEIKKEGEIDLSHLFRGSGIPSKAGKEGMKGVFGFSIKTMAGGKTTVEPFGNIKKTPKGPTVEEEREPITDVFNEKEEIKVYAEMPGVNEEGIKLNFPEISGSRQGREKGDILEIKAVSRDRKYRKEVLLPAKVKPETMTSSYKNGILEVRIKK